MGKKVLFYFSSLSNLFLSTFRSFHSSTWTSHFVTEFPSFFSLKYDDVIFLLLFIFFAISSSLSLSPKPPVHRWIHSKSHFFQGSNEKKFTLAHNFLLFAQNKRKIYSFSMKFFVATSVIFFGRYDIKTKKVVVEGWRWQLALGELENSKGKTKYLFISSIVCSIFTYFLASDVLVSGEMVNFSQISEFLIAICIG